MLAGSFAAAAQEGFGKLDPAPPEGKTAEQIVTAMGQKESAFSQARENYIFRQSVTFQTINDDNGKPDGEYKQVADIGLNRDGTRSERVVFAPQNTIERIILTREDFEDLAHRLPFVMTTKDLPDYEMTYLGRQKLDELDTYVFRAEPKVMEKKRRYFSGKLYVDQRDLQIVMASGKNVPDDVRSGHENLSPPFTTYYEQIDGKYWFPTYTKAEGTLHFGAGQGNMAQDTHVRSIVKYTDYKQFRSSSRITYDGQDVTKDDENKGATPKK